MKLSARMKTIEITKKKKSYRDKRVKDRETEEKIKIREEEI